MNLKLRTVGVLGLALASFGCVSYSYTRTTQATAEAKPATCQPEVLTIRPERSFVELGVLEPVGFHTRSIGRFLEDVGPQVCAAGGDAVLAQIDGSGEIIRGTVIRFNLVEGAPATP
ncbi:hypothetical protein ACN6A1_15550 [Myxococcus virescens]|uniref:hypothetical protein n=1 Tax=Myxococcus virescens TaxID=83456 RepID=UPI003DA57534